MSPLTSETTIMSKVAELFQAASIRRLTSLVTRTHSDRGKERYRRAGITASMSMLSQGLAILMSLISVPLTVHYLGAERYGVWLTISSLLTWIAMTDFGLAGNALVNLVAEANGNDDRRQAQEYVASAFWALTAITLGVAVVFVVAFSHIPWRLVFRISSSMSTDELHQTCALTMAVFVLGFPLNMLNSIYTGYQDGFVANVWTIAGNLVALISLIVVTQMRGGLPFLVLALSGTRVLVAFASGSYLFYRRYPWLKPWPSAASWHGLKRLSRLGSKYSVMQLAALGIYQSQPLIITQLLGPSFVMIFVIAQKVITLPHGLMFMATQPLFSAYAEANARSDWKWIRKTLRRSLLASIAVGCVLTTIVGLVAKLLIRSWAGPEAVPDTALVVWLCTYTLVATATLSPAQMLNGLEAVGRPAAALCVCAAVAIGLGILFVQKWGLSGLACAMTVGLVLAYCTVLAYEVRRVFNRHRVQPATATAFPETLSA